MLVKGPVRTWVIAQISVCPFSGGEKYYRSMRATFLNTFGWDSRMRFSKKIRKLTVLARVAVWPSVTRVACVASVANVASVASVSV